MQLYNEHLKAPPELEAVEYLSQQGYNCEVKDTRIVESSDSDNDLCYTVQQIKTTRVPFERADVVEDQIELVVCSCDSSRYHSFENVDIQQSLDGHSVCKHGRQAFRTEKAKADENQAQLV